MRKDSYQDSPSEPGPELAGGPANAAHFRDAARGPFPRSLSAPSAAAFSAGRFRRNRRSQEPVRVSRREHSTPWSPGAALEEGETYIGTRDPPWE